MQTHDTSGTAQCISDSSELANVSLDSIATRPEPTSILMCDPEFFEVKDVKNLFMEGNIDSTDAQKSTKQWQALKQTFEDLGHPVQVIESQPNLEDMVFAANQVLVGIDNDAKPYVLASRMVHESRKKEVPFYLDWFTRHNYKVVFLPEIDDLYFEGQGDALWHPEKQLLWGGWGHRTKKSAYTHISKLLNVPVLLLNLSHPKFYHLDTAFCVLDKDTVMIYPAAFDSDGLKLIRHCFPRVIELTEADANNFAGNSFALGKHVVMQQGSQNACQQLRAHGFIPVEVDTSEFMKSGGSVFCMKMPIY